MRPFTHHVGWDIMCTLNKINFLMNIIEDRTPCNDTNSIFFKCACDQKHARSIFVSLEWKLTPVGHRVSLTENYRCIHANTETIWKYWPQKWQRQKYNLNNGIKIQACCLSWPLTAVISGHDWQQSWILILLLKIFFCFCHFCGQYV